MQRILGIISRVTWVATIVVGVLAVLGWLLIPDVVRSRLGLSIILTALAVLMLASTFTRIVAIIADSLDHTPETDERAPFGIDLRETKRWR